MKTWFPKKAYRRLLDSGETLCREASMADEAQRLGGGFLYFTMPSGKKFPTKSARVLIDGEAVEPISDGLFEGSSQSFRPAEARDEVREAKDV